MSIRQSFLAILDQGACYGYQLRTEFERRTGSTWPLNIGQIYTTLDRLERDGLVERDDAASAEHVYYRITEAGHSEVTGWLTSPVERSTAAPRDELAMKLAIAVTLTGVDIVDLIQVQRSATFRTLQELTRSKLASGEPTSAEDLSWQLVVDSMIFAAEAEVRWLDHSETRLVQARAAGVASPVAIDATPPKRGRPVVGAPGAVTPAGARSKNSSAGAEA